jgi:hypothetical protein
MSSIPPYPNFTTRADNNLSRKITWDKFGGLGRQLRSGCKSTSANDSTLLDQPGASESRLVTVLTLQIAVPILPQSKSVTRVALMTAHCVEAHNTRLTACSRFLPRRNGLLRQGQDTNKTPVFSKFGQCPNRSS